MKEKFCEISLQFIFRNSHKLLLSFKDNLHQCFHVIKMLGMPPKLKSEISADFL